MGIQRTFLLAVAVAILLIGAPSTTASSAAFAPLTPSPVASVSVDSANAERVAADAASDAVRAGELLDELKRTYTNLDGVTVRMGTTPNDEQAIAYYTDGEIIVSPTHTATVDEILAHEVWHIIDWRDNGKLDWGENLPPVNSSDYLRR